MKLELKSGNISYLDQGKGPAVLLIHAFPLNNTMWASQIRALTGRFRVIVVHAVLFKMNSGIRSIASR